MSSINNTLTELIVKNFTEIKKKINIKKTKNINTQNNNLSISAVLISSEIKKIKDENKETKSEENLEEAAEDDTENKKKITVNGGYGTVSKHYGISPVVKYTDYNKIWGHLGSFRTYNMYGNNDESPNEIAMQNGESSRQMVSMETIDKAAKHFKYFVRGELMGEVGIIPPVGLNINSKDWEKYRLMTLMSIYQPLIKLMRSVA